MIDTILFDNWNTLVQAPLLMKTGASIEIFQKSFQQSGLGYDSQRFLVAYKSIAREQIAESEANGWTEIDYEQRLRLTLMELNVREPLRSRLANQAWNDYLNEWPKHTTFYPETPKLLDHLRGQYKLGVVTNFMDGPIARSIFDDLEYEAIFGSIVVSAEVGYMKPAPILLTKAMDELKAKPENTIMVGDTYDADIVGAHKAGILGVLIDHNGAPPEHINGSDAVIKGIGGIKEVLKKLK